MTQIDQGKLIRQFLDATLAAKGDWVSPKDLSDEMGVSERTINRMAARGYFPRPVVDHGKTKRWHRAQFLQMIIDRRR